MAESGQSGEVADEMSAASAKSGSHGYWLVADTQ
jgi:hypothetical protein